MTQRSRRFPTWDARLVRLEEGPPMYRMLGYADKNNLQPDLCDPVPPQGYMGPFSMPRLLPNQVFTFGPGRFGLPQASLAFTTYYWDDRAYPTHDYTSKRPVNKMYAQAKLPEERCVAQFFPEMAVPGTGVNSRCKDSGYLYVPGLPPPGAGCST